MSRIIKFESENILPLKAVSITPDRSVVKIAGANDAGKTAILRGIWMAMGGKAEIPDDAIREGQDKGFVELTIGEGDDVECTVRLNLTRRPDGSIKEHDIIFKDAKGITKSSPMALLRDLLGFGRGQFDPLEFRDAKPAEQVKMLQSALGLDFSELNAEHDEQYAKRTTVNGEVKTLSAQIPEVDDDAPDAETSVTELSEELEAAREIQQANCQHTAEVNMAVARLDVAKGEILEGKSRRDELMKQVQALDEEQATRVKVIDELEADVVNLKAQPLAEVPSVDAIKARIESVESDNAKARAKIRHGELTKQVEDLKAQSDTITTSLATIKATKEKMIADADFPIPGIVIEGGEILINDHPLANQGSAAQLRFGTLLVIKSDPRFRVVTIDEGLGKLDDESLEMVEAICDEYKFQAWLTGPRAVGEGCIVISAGEVVSDG